MVPSSCLARGRSSAHLRVHRALSQQLPNLKSPVFSTRPSIRDGLRRPGSVCPRATEQPAPTGNKTESTGQAPGSVPAVPPSAPTPAPVPGATAVPVQPAPVGVTASPAPAAAPAVVATQPPSPVAAVANAADDGFARAWVPPPGERPLWWVEKFEARRKEEAARKAADPTFVTTLERVTSESAGPNPAVQFLKGVGQVIQLVVVLALLLLLPAAMHDGGLGLRRPLLTFAAYFAFFGLGSVLRMLRYGSLTPRSRDRQVASWLDRLAFVGFVTLVPLLHMYAMYRYTGLVLYTNVISAGTTLYDLVGAGGMGLATLLNMAASYELGAAYDRVAAPEHLVTSGPYRFMQHPIYSSYMLLFFSYGLWLHSPLVALLMLLVCVLYYRRRTALEHAVLGEKFGVYYSDYARRTKKYVPFLV